MNTRLKKRGVTSLIIYYLMITLISASLAFFAGRAQGHTNQPSAPQLMSQNDADASKPDYAALHRAQRLGADCGGASDPSIVRSAVWEVICHPYTDAEPDIFAKTADTRRTRRTVRPGDSPLRAAVLSSLSTGAVDGTGNNIGTTTTTNGEPMSLALAPEIGLMGSMSNGGGNLGFNGGPNAPGGRANNIIPSTPNANATLSPPVVVTPIPAALPLMITGFAGLWAASKRRKTA
ncbi:hypothetical protein [Hyphococcus lacteus]|uniref:VPLPA-CTERM sorting domain-containing protein n=1 Tax=Hyphococcus lacteus TaxID=3143536 RepID=A0ABV3Z3P1_9PROT